MRGVWWTWLAMKCFREEPASVISRERALRGPQWVSLLESWLEEDSYTLAKKAFLDVTVTPYVCKGHGQPSQESLAGLGNSGS